MIWTFEVYPRVKVRAYEEDVYGSKAGMIWTNLTNESPAAKEIEISSPPSIARIMKVHDMPADSRIRSISSPSKGTVNNSKSSHGNGRVTTTPSNKPVNVRGCSVPRPRAVLSSPDNDGVIGKRNKLIHERSPISSKGDRTPVHVKLTKSSGKAFNCKDGLLQHGKEISKKPEKTRPGSGTIKSSQI